MNINLSYPTSWEEVTREQLAIIAVEMLKKRTKEELLLEIFRKINNMTILLRPGIDEDTPVAEFYFKRKGQKFTLPAQTIAQACNEMSFILDSVGLPESPILSVSRKLYDTSFKQYYFADAYFGRYIQTGEKSYMIAFYESLCGVKRKDLTEAEILELKIWWSGVKKVFQEMYPQVLKETDDEDFGPSKNPAEVLQDILLTLNENHPEKNPQILASDVHAVMKALNNIYLTSKKYADKNIS